MRIDERFLPVLWLALGCLAVGLIVHLVRSLRYIHHELRYIQNEIRRTRGAERRYWIQEKRRLWLTLIPFVRR